MVLFDIAITGDRILEVDETFMLIIDSTQLLPQVFLGNISQATALITDDDHECNSYCNVRTYIDIIYLL